MKTQASGDVSVIDLEEIRWKAEEEIHLARDFLDYICVLGSQRTHHPMIIHNIQFILGGKKFQD
jgi:hypothetical protein